MTTLFMKPNFKTLTAALAVAATTIAPLAVTPAAAQQDNWGDAPGAHRPYEGSRVYRKHPPKYYGQHPRPRHRPRVEYRRDNDGAAAILLGIAGAAIIAGALANPPVTRDIYVQPQNAYPPAPHRGPKVITYGGSLEPWSPGWYQWCDQRYRSFNPQKGTYRGYDGQDHFCVPK